MYTHNTTYTTNYNDNQLGGIALPLQVSRLLKASRNVNVYQFEACDEDRISGEEPNNNGVKDADNTTPRFGNNPQRKMWRIQCSETRDVSGTSKAVVSRNSCADQLRHSVQGTISLVLTLRLLSREMQSWGGARISICNRNVQCLNTCVRSLEGQPARMHVWT